MAEDAPNPAPARGGGELQSDVLAGDRPNGYGVVADIRLVGRAVNEGWPVPVDKRPAVVTRLLDIVAKPDDPNAIKAASVLVKMTGETQADRHHLERMGQQGSIRAHELRASEREVRRKHADGTEDVVTERFVKVIRLDPPAAP